MAEFYPWFVFTHLIGLVIFVACHGVSMFVAFRVRANRHARPAVAAAMEASSAAIGPMYIGLLLLAVGGLGAAIAVDIWSQSWVVASIVVFIVVIGAMYMIATPYYRSVRVAAGVSIQGKPQEAPPASDEELARLLDSRRPELLMAVGGVGLVVLLWLMVLKPG
jgi:hypothetical protein